MCCWKFKPFGMLYAVSLCKQFPQIQRGYDPSKLRELRGVFFNLLALEFGS
jgi:hypothetical protein